MNKNEVPERSEEKSIASFQLFDAVLHNAIGMTFYEVCEKCIEEKDLVKEFNRLWKHQLGVHRPPIVQMVDNACGYDPNREAMSDFFDFVRDCVCMPLIRQHAESVKGEAACDNANKANKKKEGFSEPSNKI